MFVSFKVILIQNNMSAIKLKTKRITLKNPNICIECLNKQCRSRSGPRCSKVSISLVNGASPKKKTKKKKVSGAFCIAKSAYNFSANNDTATDFLVHGPVVQN